MESASCSSVPTIGLNEPSQKSRLEEIPHRKAEFVTQLLGDESTE